MENSICFLQIFFESFPNKVCVLDLVQLEDNLQVIRVRAALELSSMRGSFDI